MCEMTHLNGSSPKEARKHSDTVELESVDLHQRYTSTSSRCLCLSNLLRLLVEAKCRLLCIELCSINFDRIGSAMLRMVCCACSYID